MTHYKDGTEAKVGDQVFGKLYNSEGAGPRHLQLSGAVHGGGEGRRPEARRSGRGGVPGHGVALAPRVWHPLEGSKERRTEARAPSTRSSRVSTTARPAT